MSIHSYLFQQFIKQIFSKTQCVMKYEYYWEYINKYDMTRTMPLGSFNPIKEEKKKEL